MKTLIKLDRFHNASLEINRVNNNHTIILVIPGDDYCKINEDEINNIKAILSNLNYNSAILRFTTTFISKDVLLNEVDSTIEYLSKKYDSIIMYGNKSGGHLAGIVGTQPQYSNIKAMILHDPVVSFLDYQNNKLINNFLKSEVSISKKELFSVEKRIDKDSIPTLIISNKDCKDVNVNHTLILVKALQENDIIHEYRILGKDEKKDTFSIIENMLIQFLKKLGL